ncbi:MAG: response regulator [Pseudomonadales bacterium]|nr:response regulator [Pseudomonadales bacterium]
MNLDIHTRSTLVVDDDRMMLRILERMLPLAGVEQVAIAEGGAKACELLRENEVAPDIILCDMHMPDLNGIEFLHQAIDLGYSGEVILMSGGASDEILMQADLLAKDFDLTVLGTLVKPVSLEGLKAVFGQL